MNKKIVISLIAIAIFLIAFFTLMITDLAKASDNTDSQRIAQWEYQINELRKLKEKCFDDLTYKESIDAYKWFTKPCVQWDEEIMSIREEIAQLKTKWYEGLE